jgi:subtilisin family serine protease
VDIAAPGTGILSTVPVGSGRESFLTVEATSYESYPMKFSAYDDVTGELYDVGYGQTEDVDGLDLSGKIALIERGFISFKDKIVNVYSKGAIGAIVFNNQQGTFIGDLQEQQDIPVISINQTDGLFLRNLVSSQTSTAHLQVAISDYEQKDGTSMSCPMVSGVIGLMLSDDPDLSQEEVLFILRSTADPLDSEFDLGAGRVNAYQALSYEPVYSKKAPVFSPLTLFALMIILSSVGLITLRKRS